MEFKQKTSKDVSDPGISPISIILSTHGGSCYDRMALYDTISSSSTPVEITCTGKVMSMGVIITLAAPVRKAYRSRTSITRDMLDEVAKRKKDWFITAEETLKLGIITEIIQ